MFDWSVIELYLQLFVLLYLKYIKNNNKLYLKYLFIYLTGGLHSKLPNVSGT